MWVLGAEPHPLQEQPVFLAVEPSLHTRTPPPRLDFNTNLYNWDVYYLEQKKIDIDYIVLFA